MMEKSDVQVIRALESRKSLDALQIASSLRIPPSEARAALSRLESAKLVKPTRPGRTITIDPSVVGSADDAKHEKEKPPAKFSLPTRFELDRDALRQNLTEK